MTMSKMIEAAKVLLRSISGTSTMNQGISGGTIKCHLPELLDGLRQVEPCQDKDLNKVLEMVKTLDGVDIHLTVKEGVVEVSHNINLLTVLAIASQIAESREAADRRWREEREREEKSGK